MLFNPRIPEFQTANGGSSQSEGFIQTEQMVVPNMGWWCLESETRFRRITYADPYLVPVAGLLIPQLQDCWDLDASGTTERHGGRPSGSLCPSSLLTHDHFHTASSSQDRDPSGGCSHHLLISVMSDSLQPMHCRAPGSSVHGILQARILEWVVSLFSRGSCRPRD